MIACRCDYKVGDLINDKYRIEQILGVGSFGNVYKIRDSNQRIYALKLLRLWEVSSDLHENLIKRFKMEFHVANMNCKYFVHSYEYGETNGNPFFTMEYCSRGDLSHLKGDILEFLPKIAHDTLSGLNELHLQGLVHRDIKPENIMIKDDDTFALTDFGIVGDKTKKLTVRGLITKRPKQVFGTYIYMSPEQAECKGHGITYLPTTDIFSIGVVFYELLTHGKYPFGELKSIEDLEKYQYNAKHEIWYKSPLQTIPNSHLWTRVIGKCIKADYRERYQNAYEIVKDIPFIRIPSKRLSQTLRVTNIVISLGNNIGQTYSLFNLLQGHRKIIRVGREIDNDIVIYDIDDSYTSRYHCTLELDSDNHSWYIRDGQWQKDVQEWVYSTNGTILNSTLLTQERKKLRVGDIITIGDLKLLVK